MNITIFLIPYTILVCASLALAWKGANLMREHDTAKYKLGKIFYQAGLGLVLVETILLLVILSQLEPVHAFGTAQVQDKQMLDSDVNLAVVVPNGDLKIDTDDVVGALVLLVGSFGFFLITVGRFVLRSNPGLGLERNWKVAGAVLLLISIVAGFVLKPFS